MKILNFRLIACFLITCLFLNNTSYAQKEKKRPSIKIEDLRAKITKQLVNQSICGSDLPIIVVPDNQIDCPYYNQYGSVVGISSIDPSIHPCINVNRRGITHTTEDRDSLIPEDIRHINIDSLLSLPSIIDFLETISSPCDFSPTDEGQMIAAYWWGLNNEHDGECMPDTVLYYIEETTRSSNQNHQGTIGEPCPEEIEGFRITRRRSPVSPCNNESNCLPNLLVLRKSWATTWIDRGKIDLRDLVSQIDFDHIKIQIISNGLLRSFKLKDSYILKRRRRKNLDLKNSLERTISLESTKIKLGLFNNGKLAETLVIPLDPREFPFKY